jgi:hypothetical protein
MELEVAQITEPTWNKTALLHSDVAHIIDILCSLVTWSFSLTYCICRVDCSTAHHWKFGLNNCTIKPLLASRSMYFIKAKLSGQIGYASDNSSLFCFWNLLDTRGSLNTHGARDISILFSNNFGKSAFETCTFTHTK